MVQGKGIKYTLFGLLSFIDGNNIANISLTYVSNIYEVLDLPIPTPEYLYQSYLRWEEIKQFKLERRNANRVKRGLLPVKSLSTRLK